MTRRRLFMGIALLIALGILSAWAVVKQESRSSSVSMRGQKAALIPFFVQPSFAFAFGNEEGDQGLEIPLAVTGHGGEVLVSDAANGRVLVYSPDGGLQRSIGNSPDAQVNLRYPYGLAVADGKLYVADMGAAAIQVYTLDGKYQRTMNKPGLLVKPTDLKIVADFVYVADAGLHQVLVLNKEGEVQARIGGPGEAEGQFRFPNGIAIAGDGTLYVADSGNNRVQIFDAAGTYLRTIGDSEHPLVATRGIAVNDGTLWVVAGLLNRIIAYDLKGAEKFSLGSARNGAQSLYLPSGLYIDQEGRIYVTEVGNKRVSVFK